VTTAGYEYSGAGPDVGLTAWGEDLPECLRQCALGVFNLIVPTASVEPLEGREVAARGASPEALLVNWLNECLYVHDLEGFVVADIGRPEVLGTGVHALLRGEPVDPSRHPRGTVVRAASREGLELEESAGRVTARISLDI
jgi:SHS2 domain-containing protein